MMGMAENLRSDASWCQSETELREAMRLAATHIERQDARISELEQQLREAEAREREARNAALEDAWAAVAQALYNEAQAVKRRARNAIRAMKGE